MEYKQPAYNKFKTLTDVNNIVQNGKVNITPDDWYHIIYAAYQINALQRYGKFNGFIVYSSEAVKETTTPGQIVSFDPEYITPKTITTANAIGALIVSRSGRIYQVTDYSTITGDNTVDSQNPENSAIISALYGAHVMRLIPYINSEGHWEFNGTDSGFNAQGPKGEQGEQGLPAGFGDIAVTVVPIDPADPDQVPKATVAADGPNTAKNFDFIFYLPIGDYVTQSDFEATIGEITTRLAQLTEV